MNRLFRTSLIFLLLLSGNSVNAQPTQLKLDAKQDSAYSQDIEAEHAVKDPLIALFELSEFSHHLLEQPSSNLEALYSQAQIAQTELEALLNRVNQQTHTQAIIPPIKTLTRAKQKIAQKLDGDASKITDLARASIVASDIPQLLASYKFIAEHTQVVQIKNRFANPKRSGYRDLNLLLRLPESKMIVEVQLHLTDIAKIKSGPEHRVYEQVQKINAKAAEQKRQLNDIEQAQITRLQQESHKLYHRAWLKYKRQASPTTKLMKLA